MPKNKAGFVPVNHLHLVSSARAEDEKIFLKWIELHFVLNYPAQAIYALSEVGERSINVYLIKPADVQHDHAPFVEEVEQARLGLVRSQTTTLRRN